VQRSERGVAGETGAFDAANALVGRQVGGGRAAEIEGRAAEELLVIGDVARAQCGVVALTEPGEIGGTALARVGRDVLEVFEGSRGDEEERDAVGVFDDERVVLGANGATAGEDLEAGFEAEAVVLHAARESE
jgi:hypothetical protein